MWQIKNGLFLVLCFLFFGCATTQISQQTFLQDEALKYSAGLLASDYLKAQVNGENGEQFASPVNFLNLHDWKIYEAEYLWDGNYNISIEQFFSNAIFVFSNSVC